MAETFYARKVLDYLELKDVVEENLPLKNVLLSDWWRNNYNAYLLLEVAELVEVAPQQLVLVGCDIAETLIHLVPWEDEAARMVLIVARRWAKGQASDLNLRMAHQACWSNHRQYPRGCLEFRATYVIGMATALPGSDSQALPRHSTGVSTAAAHAWQVHADVHPLGSQISYADRVRRHIPWEMVETQLREGPGWAQKLGGRP